jgi:DNA-binding response OmpR family regulator
VILIGRGQLTRRILTSSLGRGGFEVESAVEVDAGQELVRQRHPDAVILLDMLAKLGGVSLLQAIRSETTCPVVMVDARDDSAPSIVGFARGADENSERPNGLSELMTQIQSALRPRRAPFFRAACALVGLR